MFVLAGRFLVVFFPLFGIYLIAMFNRRATAMPALVAGIVGTVTSYYVAYQTSIGFMWPSMAAGSRPVPQSQATVPVPTTRRGVRTRSTTS